jgi:tyrosyl-tRNA synthetase
MAPSKAEARRLVAQGGVRLDGERVGEPTVEVETIPGREFQLQVGKLNFLKVVVVGRPTE